MKLIIIINWQLYYTKRNVRSKDSIQKIHVTDIFQAESTLILSQEIIPVISCRK